MLDDTNIKQAQKAFTEAINAYSVFVNRFSRDSPQWEHGMQNIFILNQVLTSLEKIVSLQKTLYMFEMATEEAKEN